MMRNCCWHVLNKAHSWRYHHPSKRQCRQADNLFLGVLLVQWDGGTTPREMLPPGTPAYWKIGISQENWLRVPWDTSSSCPDQCGLGVRYKESLHLERAFLLSEAIVLGFCCWAHLCPFLLPCGKPSFRHIRIKTMRDFRTGNCTPRLFFLLRQSCSGSGTGNMCSHKIAVLM